MFWYLAFIFLSFYPDLYYYMYINRNHENTSEELFIAI